MKQVWLLGLAAAVSCTGITDDDSQVVQLVIVLPRFGIVSLEETETTTIPSFALTRAGDSVQPGITWKELAPQGAIELDTLTGTITGLREDTTTIQARFQTLLSDPIPVRVLAAADSLRLVGANVDTLTAVDSISNVLEVELLDIQPGNSLVPLGNRPVRFAVIEPASAAVDFLGNPDSLAITVLTNVLGRASARLARRPGGTPPDSVIVEASATRASGAVVAGSPIRFTVHFQ